MDSDKKWEILSDLLKYMDEDDFWSAHTGSFLIRHDYIILKEYPMAIVADPNARLVGTSGGFHTEYGEQTLITLKGKELKRKLKSSTERIMAIKELSDLIEEDKIYAEENDDYGSGF